jgi:hypothetical protein
LVLQRFAAFHDNQAAAAQKANIKLQIKPNAASGGFQLGWFKLKYHSSRLVTKAPAVAKLKLSTLEMIKDCQRINEFMD